LVIFLLFFKALCGLLFGIEVAIGYSIGAGRETINGLSIGMRIPGYILGKWNQRQVKKRALESIGKRSITL